MRATADPVSCPGCGALVTGELAGCLDLYHQAVAPQVPGVPTWLPRLAWDTYAVQHPDQYIGRDRPKGLIHLAAVGWALEYGGHPTGYRALHEWVDRRTWAGVPMPALPDFRGAVTVVDVARELAATPDPAVRAQTIEEWARAAWTAYASLQPLMRTWIAAALNARGGRRH